MPKLTNETEWVCPDCGTLGTAIVRDRHPASFAFKCGHEGCPNEETITGGFREA